MTRVNHGSRLLIVLLTAGLVLAAGDLRAHNMTDFTAVPPFVTDVVTPNVLLVLDTSGSMAVRAYCDKTGESFPGMDDFDNCPAWDATVTYSGLFDPLKCYTYNSTSGLERFEEAQTKPLGNVFDLCDTDKWDGNMLNWITMRRMDAAKIAMIGGSCATSRAADGSCNTTGSGGDAKITLKGIDVSGSGCCVRVRTPPVKSKTTGWELGAAYGRVPIGKQPGNLKYIYFHLPHKNSSLMGGFCLDDDAVPMKTGASDCQSEETGPDDSDAFTEQFYKIRVAVPAQRTGVIQDLGSRARFGLGVFEGSKGMRILTPIGWRQAIEKNSSTISTFSTNTAAMIDAVEDAQTEDSTPLAETLYDAVRYIAQVEPASDTTKYMYPYAFSPAKNYNQSGAGGWNNGELKAMTSGTCPSGYSYLTDACGRDPYLLGDNHTPAWASPSQVVSCCKTFILLFTDGWPLNDVGIPDALKDYGHGLHGTHCTGGFTMTTCAGHKTDYGGPDGTVSADHYLDDVAYWAHTNDLRQATIPVINESGHDLPGVQNVTVYTFFAFGGDVGRELLSTTAKLGAFDDINGNGIPDLQAEYDNVNNYTGAAGADGLPDAYFESGNADDLKSKLAAAITSILARSAAGTSISVLATSSTGEGSLYQAYFFPKTFDGNREVKWTGYTQGLFLDALGNIREDTNQDGKLVYPQDNIIVYRFDSVNQDVKVDRYKDLDGDGKPDTTTPFETVGLRDTVGIWEAGRRLAELSPGASCATANGGVSCRRLLTWVDGDNDGYVDIGETLEFTTANAATIGPYLDVSGTAPYTADNVIDFIRGTQVAGLRDRQLTVGGTVRVWKFGDPIHSTPVIVGPPKERFDILYGDASYSAYYQQYRTRRQMAYVGANDGMLHAFNGGYYHRGDDPTTTNAVEHGWFTRTPTNNSGGPLLGAEKWAYIPYELLPNLAFLADPNYAHAYFVDLKPKVTDARIFTPDTDHPNGWGTILIGGFRLGGSCKDCTSTGGGPEIKVNVGGTDRIFYSAYFVLDITNPEVDPKLLWSFATEKLELTSSYPTVVRASPLADAPTDNTNAKWYAVFGSGPTAYAGSSGQEGRVFVVDLKTGPKNAGGSDLFQEIVTGTSSSFLGDLIALDADLDYRTDAVYGGSILDTGSSNPKWAGKLFRLTTGTAAPFGGQTNPANWGYGSKPTVLLANFACSPTPCNGSTKVGPIQAAPSVASDGQNIWVFFGTGRYYSNSDKTTTETQYFFGVKDPVVSGTCTQTSDLSCQRNDLVSVTNATVCVVCTSGTDQVTGVTGVTDLATLQGLVASKNGWYTTMPASRERVIVSPTVLGGIVFFPSFVPIDDLCSAAGDGYLYALFYLTGSAYKESVIGTYASGGNTNVKRSTSMGQGLASQVAIHIGGQDTDSTTGVSGRAKACSQSSTGALVCSKVNPALSSWSRYLSWIQQYQ